MKDENKSKDQLINELVELRQRITELKASKTEYKQMKEALMESEEKFRTFMESASDLMYATDADGNFTYVNEAMAIVLGYTKEELIGMHLSRIASKENLERYNLQEEELIAKGKITFEPILIRKDVEKIHGEIKIVALYDSDGRYAGSRGIFRDITERKKMEEERENLIEELQEALAKIKTLRGLLPICSSCKKIRDDKGYWHQVEIYIQNHSEAEFTHGFCPECLNNYLAKLNKDN